MRHCLVALAFIVPSATVARADGPVCALLDPERHPRVALLEAKLLTDAAATWVERADIDKVLKEQKLQAMFSPQGVGERVKLGKLLKADVLVMVRSVKGAESPTLEVAVGETASGLRLMFRAVPVTKSTDDDVAALLAAVREGIKRHGEKITEVVAVPPFVSNDLEFTHDYLKGALAKLAEGEALGRKGVVVVELAEAEALAKEIALTDPGARVNRPLPVYLMGEYRNEGKGKDRTISLKLRAERGGKLLVKAVELKAKAGEESDGARKWAAQTLDVVLKDDKPRPPADPNAEAKQLAERAKVFASLGGWAEAHALLEACILLDPGHFAFRVEVLRVLTRLMEQTWNAISPKLEDARKAHTLYRRGLEHLETATFRDELLPTGGSNDVSEPFLRGGNGLLMPWPDVKDPKVIAVMADMRRERRETILRMMPTIAKSGKYGEQPLVWLMLWGLTPKEQMKLVGELINQYQELPMPRERITSILVAARPIIQKYAPHVEADAMAEFLALFDRLAAAKNADVRDTAAAVKTRWLADLDAAKKAERVGVVEGQAVSLRHIELTVPKDQFFGGAPQGIFPVGPGVDAVLGPSGLYLMKEKGVLRRVWAPKIPCISNYPSAFYDGKYVWVTKDPTQAWGLVAVVDPVTEKSWEVTEADGLPRGTDEQLKANVRRSIMAAPIEPGRVCVAGSFGRAWVAVVSFDAATGKAEVKVIHEAKEVEDPRDKEQGARATVNFHPNFMFTLKGKTATGQLETRVVIGRGGSAAFEGHPLLVDPGRSTVEVPRAAWPKQPQLIRYQPVHVIDGSAYFHAYILGQPPESHVFRASFPNLTPEPVVRRLPTGPGSTITLDGRFHVALRTYGKPGTDGKVWSLTDWWTADADGKNPRRLARSLPSILSLWVSSHYGLVAVAAAPGKPWGLYTVEIALDPPKK